MGRVFFVSRRGAEVRGGIWTGEKEKQERGGIFSKLKIFALRFSAPLREVSMTGETGEGDGIFFSTSRQTGCRCR